MSRHPKADLYMAERDAGLTYAEIAAKCGVTAQCVAQSCARYGAGHFKPYTMDEVVYPNLRKWLNDNKVTRREFIRRMGNVAGANQQSQLSAIFRGDRFPIKKTMDKFIKITGLTYEQLFATDDCPKPQTNEDRFRTKSGEELAAYLVEIGWDCHLCSEHDRLSDNPLLRNERCDEKCEEHCAEWLRQPVKDGDNE